MVQRTSNPFFTESEDAIKDKEFSKLDDGVTCVFCKGNIGSIRVSRSISDKLFGPFCSHKCCLDACGGSE